MGNSPGRSLSSAAGDSAAAGSGQSPAARRALRRTQSAPVEFTAKKPRATPDNLTRMLKFANTLDDTFDLMEGLYNQIESRGNTATLTKAELDLLTTALRSLCSLQASQHQESAIPEDDPQDASSLFLGEEYALSSGPRNVIRDAIMSDLRHSSVGGVGGKSLRARRESCLYLVNNLKPIVESYLDKLNDWSFDVLDMRELAVTENPLVVVTMASLACQGLMEGFITDEIALVEYLKRVEASYYDNPYHNAWHAADVVQATNYGILTCAARVSFPRIARFAAVIAAAVHDVGHLGVNNAFLISTSHQLALQYSDSSPLEMMHANKAFAIMQKPECNILKHFPSADRVAIRKIMISMVLSTDNAKHSSLLESFTRMRVSDSMNLDENAGDQLVVLSMLLHSMDVSNVARPWAISRKWLELISIEFYAQGDAERTAGIPVTPIMDRHTTTPVSRFQIGFISYIVKPLFVEMGNAGLDVAEPLSCIDCNLSSWESIVCGQCTMSEMDQSCGYVTPGFLEQVTSSGGRFHRISGDFALGASRSDTRGSSSGLFALETLEENEKVEASEAADAGSEAAGSTIALSKKLFPDVSCDRDDDEREHLNLEEVALSLSEMEKT